MYHRTKNRKNNKAGHATGKPSRIGQTLKSSQTNPCSICESSRSSDMLFKLLSKPRLKLTSSYIPETCLVILF